MTVLEEETLIKLKETIKTFDVKIDDEKFRIVMCGEGCIDCSALCENDSSGDDDN